MKLLEQVAVAAALREGTEGIRNILASVAHNKNISLKELANTVHMPLPVVAAVRRELERRYILSRDKGICLTLKGIRLVSDLGIQKTPSPEQNLLSILREISSKRPEANVALDQAYARPETSFRRATYASQHDALSGRNVVLLGDDDLTSIAIALLLKKEKKPKRLVVVDIDSRIIDLINEASETYDLNIECHLHDLRISLPTELKYNFQTFFTDPPYTLAGLELFLSRASETLEGGSGKQGFLSFGNKDPDTDLGVFHIISQCGFIPQEIINKFNTYHGGTVIGNISRMIRMLSGTQRAHLPSSFNNAIYTADTNPSQRS